MKKLHFTANKGFTLLEIVVALGILLIIASIALVSYVKFIDSARESVCENNLDGLRNAIQIYVSEEAALPATLGDLNLEQLQQGFEIAMKNADWKTRLSHSMVEISIPAEAHAFTLTYDDLRLYGASETIFRCPLDHNGGASYAINTAVAGRKWTEINADTILIAESDSYTFNDTSDLQYRHGDMKKALGITRSGSMIKLNRDSSEIVSDIDIDIDNHVDDNDVSGEGLQGVAEALQRIIDNNPGTPLADKAEDALASAQTALDELDKTQPDNQAAIGNIESVVNNLEAAVKDGLLDSAEGKQFNDQLASAASQLAVDAINLAISQGGDQGEIEEAQNYLAQGESQAVDEAYRDAVSMYKDALAKAESAMP